MNNTTDTEHTPGPWKLSRGEVNSYQHDFILETVASNEHVAAWSIPRIDSKNTRQRSKHIKRARLIAAAPELLHALRYIEGLAMADEPRDLPTIAQAARAAIAKATGQKDTA